MKTESAPIYVCSPRGEIGLVQSQRSALCVIVAFWKGGSAEYVDAWTKARLRAATALEIAALLGCDAGAAVQYVATAENWCRA